MAVRPPKVQSSRDSYDPQFTLGTRSIPTVSSTIQVCLWSRIRMTRLALRTAALKSPGQSANWYRMVLSRGSKLIDQDGAGLGQNRSLMRLSKQHRVFLFGQRRAVAQDD